MRIDVIIPVYNGAACVRRAVESALQFPEAHVILVDDGSTDGSGRICDELTEDGRVTTLHQKNLGASAARNAGLAAAQAEFVTFLDADDMLLPGALTLLTDKGADAAYGMVTRRDERPSMQSPRRVQSAREALETALNDPTAHLHTHGWLFRRELLTERFDEALTLGEDGEWLLRTLLHMKRIHRVNAPIYRYFVQAGSAVRAGTDVCGRYMQTLQAAEEPLARAQMPAAVAMYRLTHLLLMLTHGVFRRREICASWREAAALRESPMFRDAFRQAELTGHSPRIWTLRLLKWRLYPAVWLAVRIRQRRNDRAARGK